MPKAVSGCPRERGPVDGKAAEAPLPVDGGSSGAIPEAVGGLNDGLADPSDPLQILGGGSAALIRGSVTGDASSRQEKLHVRVRVPQRREGLAGRGQEAGRQFGGSVSSRKDRAVYLQQERSPPWALRRLGQGGVWARRRSG